MRIDEIDLEGNFKIKGSVGSQGQFLGMSGSELFWLDSAQGGGGGGISTYGTRYVYCESVTYSATMSGQILKNAYASASTIAGLSVEDRAVVLISPGVYDFLNSPLNITDSYIDLVGINSSADNVRLKASNADYVIEMIGGGVDMGLYNVTIGTASKFNVNSGIGDYMRWDNVINRGNMFARISPNFSSQGINGEFRNIKCLSPGGVTVFSLFSADINGIYENIEISGGNNISSFNCFTSGTISGTYSNIRSDTGDMFGATNINNFYIDNVYTKSFSFFLIANSNNVIVKNIVIEDGGNAFNGNFSSIIAENIKITSSIPGEFFRSFSGSIMGTFSNIEVNSVNNLFYCSGSGDISGTFKNIVCNNTDAFGFSTTSGTISGTFENITLGDTGEGYFRTDAVGGISGTFKNIEMGYITSGAFYSSAAMNGTFSNIKTGSIDGFNVFYSGGDMSGTYEDIQIVEIISNNLFYSVGQMNGTFKNITCGTVAAAFMYSESPIGSTFSNIEVGNVGLYSFFSDFSIDATATDITIGEVGSNIFSNNSGGISGYFENIYVKSVLGTMFFNTGDYLYGTFKDIYLGSSTDCLIFNVASGPIDGTFQNIELFMDGVSGTLFFGSSITGIFDNITNNHLITTSLPAIYLSALFDTGGSGAITGTFSNLYLGGASSAFSTLSNEPILGTFRNINISVGGSVFDGTIVLGTIEKSTIYSKIALWSGGRIVDTAVYANFLIGALDVIYLTGATNITIERCKFIGNSNVSTKSINGIGSARISYTLTNKGIVTVTNLIGTPFNINDASIT
jgi:hypothetical protein